MKKSLILLSLFALVGTLQAQQNKRVTIRNNTGYTITQLYSSASIEDWNDVDQLGDETLAFGDEVVIRVDADLDCAWDFKAIDEDGDEYIKQQEICENSTVDFTIDDLVDAEETLGGDEDAEADIPVLEEDTAGLETYRVTFENKTGKEIYITRWTLEGMQDEMEFSEDILGEENTLEVNEEEEIRFSAPADSCDFIFLFEAEGETTYRKEVNLCPYGETIQIKRSDKISE